MSESNPEAMTRDQLIDEVILLRNRVVDLLDVRALPPNELRVGEAKVFNFLLKNRDRVCSRASLLAAVYSPAEAGFYTPRLIDSYIKRIRQKTGNSKYTISAVYGLGYRLEEVERA